MAPSRCDETVESVRRSARLHTVKVTEVNTLNRPGKRKRTRSGFGTRKSIKRAIVTLREGDRIDVFGAPA